MRGFFNVLKLRKEDIMKCENCKWLHNNQKWCDKGKFLVSSYAVFWEKPPACPGFELKTKEKKKAINVCKKVKMSAMRLPLL